MNWFKFHHDALNDPKVQRLPGDLFKAWVNLLCLASQQPARGSLPPVEDCAFALRLDVLAMADLANQLANAGLLEREPGGYSIHNWNGRQYDKPSDAPERVNERVRKHRERKSNADVTPMKRPGNAIDTDTDTERETEQKVGAAAQKPALKALPRNGPAQSIVAAWYACLGGAPVSYPKAVGLGQKLADLGCTEGEVAELYDWMGEQEFFQGKFDMGTAVTQFEKFRQSKKPRRRTGAGSGIPA
jgi:hypothetical protein